MKRLTIVFLLTVGTALLNAATPVELVEQYVLSMMQAHQLLEPVKTAADARNLLPRIMEAADRVEAAISELRRLGPPNNNPALLAVMKSKGSQVQEAHQKLLNEMVRIQSMPPVRRELRGALRKLRAQDKEDTVPNK